MPKKLFIHTLWIGNHFGDTDEETAQIVCIYVYVFAILQP